LKTKTDLRVRFCLSFVTWLPSWIADCSLAGEGGEDFAIKNADGAASAFLDFSGVDRV